MKCPACSAEVDEKRPRCPSCSGEYLKLFEQRAWQSLLESQKPRVRLLPGRRGLALALAGMAAAGLLSLWLITGLPRERGGASAFALTPPPGWVHERSHPPELLRVRSGTLVLTVRRVEAETARLAATDAGAQALVEREFDGAQPRLAERDAVLIAGIESLRVRARGAPVLMASPNAGRKRAPEERPAPPYESLPLEGLLLVVPSGKGGYLIKVMGDAESFARRRAELAALLGSIQVLR